MPSKSKNYNGKGTNGPKEGPNSPPGKKVTGTIEQGSDGKPGGQKIKNAGSGTKAHKMMSSKQSEHSTKD